MIENDEIELQQQFVERIVTRIALIVAPMFIILGIALTNQIDSTRVMNEHIERMEAFDKLVLERLGEQK